jgi:hypothetical protein
MRDTDRLHHLLLPVMPDDDSHDAWRALNIPPPADPFIETANRLISLLEQILARIEEREGRGQRGFP